jgi:glycogen operon protein
MLLGGDELGRTQHGNNNAWCQDNELSWFDWELGDEARELLEYVCRLVFMRRRHPVFRRRKFLEGTSVDGSGLPDVVWFRSDGRRMARRDWEAAHLRTLGMFLNGDELHDATARGEPIGDESFLLLFNAHHEPARFALPARRYGARWKLELSTADPHAAEVSYDARATVELEARSLLVLRRAW